MLREVRVSNFRIFEDEVAVRFRPITVLIGKNNSGKSSVIRFLLMLDRSTYVGREQFPVMEGHYQNAGSFKEHQNANSELDDLGFSVSLRSPFWGSLPLMMQRIIGMESRNDDVRLAVSFEGGISYVDKSRRGILRYTLGEEDMSPFEYDTSFEDDFLFFDRAIMRRLSEIYDLFSSVRGKELDVAQLEKSFGGHIRRYEMGNFIREQLHSMAYVPPVTYGQKRVVDVSDVQEYGLYGGEDDIIQLYRFVRDDEETYRFILSHLDKIGGIRSLKFEEIGESKGIIAVAENSETGANVPIVDFGFGVSQCLPVLVRGAALTPHSTLIVEQPEVHLHPTAHMEMGSYFAELWKRRKVGSIIETHSGNLLLRLRRLISKGELLTEDVSVAYFTVDSENGNMPMVKNLDIDERGGMEEGLPMEFFGADILEGLQLGART